MSEHPHRGGASVAVVVGGFTLFGAVACLLGSHWYGRHTHPPGFKGMLATGNVLDFTEEDRTDRTLLVLVLVLSTCGGGLLRRSVHINHLELSPRNTQLLTAVHLPFHPLMS
jgi:hypothetical protein